MPTIHKPFFTAPLFIVALRQSLTRYNTLTQATRYPQSLTMQGSSKIHIAMGNEMPYLEGTVTYDACAAAEVQK